MKFPFPQPIPLGGPDREGMAWRAGEIDAWACNGGLALAMLLGESNAAMRRGGDFFMPDMTKAYEEATEVLEKARQGYMRVLDEFRSTIKNDLASVAASANKVQNETVKMATAYRNAIGILTSAEMSEAIANAERLAAALQAISDLKSHSITFAVLDRKTANQPGDPK